MCLPAWGSQALQVGSGCAQPYSAQLPVSFMLAAHVAETSSHVVASKAFCVGELGSCTAAAEASVGAACSQTAYPVAGLSAAEVHGLRLVQCLACLLQISKGCISIVSGLHAATVHELHPPKYLAGLLQRCMS